MINHQSIVICKGEALLGWIVKTLGSLSFLLPISSQHYLWRPIGSQRAGELTDVVHPSQPPRRESRLEKVGEQIQGGRWKIVSTGQHTQTPTCTDVSFLKIQINFILQLLLNVHVRDHSILIHRKLFHTFTICIILSML